MTAVENGARTRAAINEGRASSLAPAAQQKCCQGTAHTRPVYRSSRPHRRVRGASEERREKSRTKTAGSVGPSAQQRVILLNGNATARTPVVGRSPTKDRYFASSLSRSRLRLLCERSSLARNLGLLRCPVRGFVCAKASVYSFAVLLCLLPAVPVSCLDCPGLPHLDGRCCSTACRA